MTTLGAFKPGERKHIRVSGFDFDAVPYDKEDQPRVWHLKVDQNTTHHDEYFVRGGEFFNAEMLVFINSPLQGGMVLGEPIDVSPKEKEAALAAIKEFENPSTQV